MAGVVNDLSHTLHLNTHTPTAEIVCMYGFERRKKNQKFDFWLCYQLMDIHVCYSGNVIPSAYLGKTNHSDYAKATLCSSQLQQNHGATMILSDPPLCQRYIKCVIDFVLKKFDFEYEPMFGSVVYFVFFFFFFVSCCTFI